MPVVQAESCRRPHWVSGLLKVAERLGCRGGSRGGFDEASASSTAEKTRKRRQRTKVAMSCVFRTVSMSLSRPRRASQRRTNLSWAERGFNRGRAEEEDVQEARRSWKRRQTCCWLCTGGMYESKGSQQKQGETGSQQRARENRLVLENTETGAGVGQHRGCARSGAP